MAEHILSANEKFAEAVGYDYGPASSTVQAAMLNGFARSLRVACGGRSYETQVAYIVDELTPETRAVFLCVAGMIGVSE